MGATSSAGSDRRRSAGAGVLLGQVAVDVILADPVGPPHPGGGQLPGLDQPVHRHVGHPKLIGYLGHRYEPGPGLVWLHARRTTLLRTWSVRQYEAWGKWGAPGGCVPGPARWRRGAGGLDDRNLGEMRRCLRRFRRIRGPFVLRRERPPTSFCVIFDTYLVANITRNRRNRRKDARSTAWQSSGAPEFAGPLRRGGDGLVDRMTHSGRLEDPQPGRGRATRRGDRGPEGGRVIAGLRQQSR